MKPVVRIFATLVLGLVAFSTPSSAQNEPDPWMAAITGDLNTLQRALEAGVNPDVREPNGSTPLMLAARSGSPKAVTVLLIAGADINAVNEADFTALHGAAFRGLNEIVQILVENGADINARDFRGRTSFRLAEGSKQSFQFQAWPETAELLRTLGADTSLGAAGNVQERQLERDAADLDETERR